MRDRWRGLIGVMAAAAALMLVATSSGLAASPAGTATGDLLVFKGDLDASQVVAGSSSTATGSATVKIDTVNKVIITDLEWTGLTGVADRSHLHSAPPGEPSDGTFFHEVITAEARTVVPCPWDTGWDGCAPTSGSLHDELSAPDGYWGCDTFQCIVDTAVPNGFYLDIHTLLYEGGEIRGQLVIQTDPTVVPDGRVRAGLFGRFIGNDIYNDTGRYQRVVRGTGAYTTLEFQVSVQNDSTDETVPFVVTATGAATPGFQVQYWARGRDVTGAITGDGFTTRVLGPGARTPILVRVIVGPDAAAGTFINRLVTIATDETAPTVDAVRIVARRR